jgi:N-acetylmuramic acid 6-phosphate etherase
VGKTKSPGQTGRAKHRNKSTRSHRLKSRGPSIASPFIERITERSNPVSADLDTKSTREILEIINREDHAVAPAVRKVTSQIARAVNLAIAAHRRGGRLVYLGAGTSGRLGVLDAAECIPTFGTDSIVGVMAGAPGSMFRPSEVSEDDPRLAVRDLRRIRLHRQDVVVGISASGRTPYVLGGLRHARDRGCQTVVLTSNPDAPIIRLADVAIVPVVGPEVIAGSTRMKAGTAQKLVLNMLSTATMVRLGRVFSNLMIFVQMNNEKLRQRGREVLVSVTGASLEAAARALVTADGRLPVALLMLMKKVSKREALKLLRTEPSIPKVFRELGASAKLT